MFILQNIVLPNNDINAPEDLYLRKSPGVTISKKNKKIYFNKGSSCGFDTYFNSFTINVWKEKTTINDIKLKLFGAGNFIIKVYRHKLYDYLLLEEEEEEVQLRDEGVCINFANLANFSEGMLFFELIALSDDAILSKGFYYTEEQPLNDIKLGIVITHFNRKHYVLPAINRVSNDLLEDEYYKGKIQLIVVDNSQNISPEEAKKAIVLPNKNLGGSGGFTRGLLYLENDTSFSHCLFMDDDASCEIESIRRAYSLLQYTNQSMFAIAGAQLRESVPYEIHEKGARFENGNCMPLHHTKDMRNIESLLLSEFEDISPNYGAWWFFAFAIKDVKKYPFPFFVRGDDMLFSLQNKFNICTLNGIGVWGEDFFIKESPLTRYLGFRAVNVCNVLMKNNYSRKDLINSFSKWYLSNLFSYNYSSAKSIKLSLIDFLNGVESFTSDLDASEVRRKINNLPAVEKMDKIYRKQHSIAYKSMSESTLRKSLRFISINGLLLPNIFMKDKMVFQSKGFRANFRQIFGFNKVFYEHEGTRTGYIAKHSKKELFLGLFEYINAIFIITSKFNKAKQNYISEEPQITTKEFWENIYSDKK